MQVAAIFVRSRLIWQANQAEKAETAQIEHLSNQIKYLVANHCRSSQSTGNF